MLTARRKTRKERLVRNASSNRTFWIALVAAGLVVLQLAVGPAAAKPGAVELDAFGNPVCSNGRADHGIPGDHRPCDCCLFGSCWVAPASLGGRDAFFVVRPRVGAGEPPDREHPVACVTRDDHDPGRPRAPPLTA